MRKTRNKFFIAMRGMLMACSMMVGVTTCLFSQPRTVVKSPDGSIVFTLQPGPAYTVNYKGKSLIESSAINLNQEGQGYFERVSFYKSPQVKEIHDSYELIVGKARRVNEVYSQAVFFLQDSTHQENKVDLEVRVFNDGVAFRYVIPSGNRGSFVLLDEKTEFRFATEPVVKALLLPDFFSSHEGLYTTAKLGMIKDDTLMDMPALFQFADSVYLAITEAALLDHAGMYLVRHDGILCSTLSPLPGQQIIKVRATLPHRSPWRVLLIGSRPGVLIESNIITTLNAPPAKRDWSWLRPGTATFPWWNGTIIPDKGVTGGNNFETNKYYIDFCAANNIRYHTVVEYAGHEWYTNNGHDYQPGDSVDITRPVDGLDMKKICDYGRKKNVGIRVWTHWKALYPKLDTAFAVFEEWGLSGMMVDFMDRDDQEMVNIQTEILQKAAAHHLHIQFHGAYKPTGLSRTYPNEFTREGTLNYEHDKWDNTVNPNADINIPFTRMLGGSTDYHLGGFRALPFDKFVVQNFRPYVIGTRCHMLAMYVVLENYLSMVCDYPEAYIGQPGFEVIRQMPTTWDETRVPSAVVDEYVSIARRKNGRWFIGSITDSTARRINVPLYFLPAGKYRATIYSDAPDMDTDANHLVKKTMVVDRSAVLELALVSGGGNLIILDRIKQ